MRRQTRPARAREVSQRRFAYEEGIRTAFFVRYPKLAKPGSVVEPMVLALDIAPARIELAGGRPGPQIQGRSIVPLLKGRARDWRKSFLIEYYNESAWPWIVGMSYKAVRTERAKLIHWVHYDGCDELYDLAPDPYELHNRLGDPAYQNVREAFGSLLTAPESGSACTPMWMSAATPPARKRSRAFLERRATCRCCSTSRRAPGRAWG